MRWFILAVVAVSLVASSQAHHPDRAARPVHPYYDLIGPLGTRLPMSHRRKYNRPTKLGGRLAYLIAPSSQEAMAWHRAQHRGHYENHRPRMVTHYFYPKPWESLRIGARPRTTSEDATEMQFEIESPSGYSGDLQDAPDLVPIPLEQPMDVGEQLIDP